MDVLVTGANGFLGSHLCRKLVEEGFKVTVLIRPNSNLSALDGLPVEKKYGDVTDAGAVNAAVEGHDFVFHAAAHLSYWGNQKEIQNKINVEGTKNVVEACLRGGVKKLVHVSSTAAVGIPRTSTEPAGEDFRFNLENLPTLNYHLSKKRGEEIVLRAVEKGLDAVIVNPSTIWGRFGKIYRGAEIARKVQHSFVVPYFTGGICVVHVSDVVDGIIAAWRHGKTGERYILGGENLTLQAIARAVARAQNLRRQFVPVPTLLTGLSAFALESWGRITKTRPRITFTTHYCASRFHYYDSGKARNELGFSPSDFKSILNECLAFVESQNGKQE